MLEAAEIATKGKSHVKHGLLCNSKTTTTKHTHKKKSMTYSYMYHIDKATIHANYHFKECTHIHTYMIHENFKNLKK